MVNLGSESMGFSIGGGIGPLRGSVRLSGRGGGSSELTPQEIFFMTAGIALFFGGTIAAAGLRGEGGITGRILGVIFTLISFMCLFHSPLVGTYFATSWVYYGLTKVHYFNLFNLLILEPPKIHGIDLDGFVLLFGLLLVAIVGGALVLLIPPALVFFILRKLHAKYPSMMTDSEVSTETKEPRKMNKKIEPEVSNAKMEPEIQAVEKIHDPTLGKLPAKADAGQIKRWVSEILIDDEVLNFTCATQGSMKDKLAIFTNQRIIFLYAKNLQITREYFIGDIQNVSFYLGGYTLTSVDNNKFNLMVDKSDRESINKYLESSSIGTLSEKEFRKAKSRERK
jgi:hypothetical protein